MSRRSHARAIAIVNVVVALFATLGFAGPASAELVVVSTSPARSQNNVPTDTAISITFNQAVNTATVADNIRLFGRWSGVATGAFSYSNGNQTVTFTPDDPFTVGDPVTVTLSHDLQAADLSFLRSQGYSWRFTTKTLVATLNFTEIDEFSNRTTPKENTRIYGAAGADLNDDGWLDLSMVNEDSADLRVCLNSADGSGLFEPFLDPPCPLTYQSSPNEPADFNNDGKVDLCICSGATSVVSVLLGNGDGTFADQIIIPVGEGPHGIAVLDADGDGDTDIAAASVEDNNVSLIINNGDGTFGPSTQFEGGGDGEWALASADMNNDGILDLVVGAIWSQRVIIHRGNGDGTFTNISNRSAGGSVWMISVGDVNNDGNEDVSTANSGSASGSILKGTGLGTLAAADVTPAGAHANATDLGDLDGDGDLDWVLSAFAGGDWRVYLNDGTGEMTQVTAFEAAANPSCAIIMDLDNDGRVDLVLTDEIADLVTLMRNPPLAGDVNGDGTVTIADVVSVITAFGSACPPPCAQDINGDGNITIADITAVLSAFGSQV